MQEHKHLLKILFANELQKSQCAPFTWNGQFSKEVRSTGKSYTARIFYGNFAETKSSSISFQLSKAVVILAQHANQGKLTGAETALARWLVFVHTHCDLPLDYRDDLLMM